jgi:hypothetical protein
MTLIKVGIVLFIFIYNVLVLLSNIYKFYFNSNDY